VAEVIQPEFDASPRLKQNCSVWLLGQRSKVSQRGARYVSASFDHPGKMLPDLAAAILETYGGPGLRWLDPMCGIGTLLVEGIDRGYQVDGVEFEDQWVEVTKQNITLAVGRMGQGSGQVRQGDARHLPDVLGVRNHYDRIAFSPPYGDSLSKKSHGPDKHPERQQGGKRAAAAIRRGYNVSADDPNIGDLKYGDLEAALELAKALAQGMQLQVDKPSYLTEMAKVYHSCFEVLRPGGLMILVMRDFRRNNRRVDLLGDTLDICEALGFIYHDRSTVLLSPAVEQTDGLRVKPEGSVAFWTLFNAQKADPPLMVPVSEDVVVLRK
jgi:modification methylase